MRHDISQAAGEDIATKIWNPETGRWELTDSTTSIAQLRFAEDQRHAEMAKHQVSLETTTVCGFAVRRPACSCGWRGEWVRR